ncbi:MAG: LUD domain-containing protein [Oscillospiraceae bacterium]|jgi:L-lactate utilization protein LutB|nr:LUD domain-containing protein [Oscillospiraceae bacterium]
MNFDHLREKLEKNGFTVSVFATGEEAAAYLNEQIDQRTVGMGGSMTIAELGLRESLSRHNVVFSHGFTPAPPAQVQQLAAGAEIYLLSANGIAGDTGEILNIDGTGNRVSSSLYGHRKVYLLAGRNKISPNFHSALQRVRNVVAPKNAQRLGRKTPCAARGDRCYDCDSPERICRGLTVLYKKMGSMDMEVVLVDQELGY